MDLLFIGIVVVFFILSPLYLRFCEMLSRNLLTEAAVGYRLVARPV